jgi:Ca2+/H+ antiporter, TMEM165/GDT1 family
MIAEMIKACFFILMAEMGDKTQILALAFATKYKVQKVLLGVLIGSFLNHGLAVILGAYLSSVIPLGAIKLIAACSFIGFGLWSLKSEDEEEEGETKEKFGPVLTVAMAFFIGELGDKTQLTAITLSTDSPYPAFILLGTVTGMIITSGIGIFVGSKLGKRIPEFTMKIISSAIFIFFGILGLFDSVPKQYITVPNIVIFFILLIFVIYILLAPSLKQIKEKRLTPLKRAADKLYESVRNIKPSLESMCLGSGSCGGCQKGACPVGRARAVLECAITKGEYTVTDEYKEKVELKKKDFDREKNLSVLNSVVANCLNCGKGHDKNCVINKVRELMEMEYFGEVLDFNGDVEEYKKLLDKKLRKIS